MDDEWFVSAAQEAAATPKARAAREAAKPAPMPPFVQPPMPQPFRPEAAREALAAFAAADKSRLGGLGLGPSGPPSAAAPLPSWGGTIPNTNVRTSAITPEQGLDAIIKAVKADEDPFSAVGFWLTKVTTALTEILKEEQDDEG